MKIEVFDYGIWYYDKCLVMFGTVISVFFSPGNIKCVNEI